MICKRKLATLITLAVVLTPLAYSKSIDKTIAVVNGEAIMGSEYHKAIDPILEQIKASNLDAKDISGKITELKKNLLDQMVDEKILKQEAKKAKIKITKRDIDDGMKVVKKRFNSENEFQKELNKEGITNEQFQKRIEEQLMVMKLIEQEVKYKVSKPSDDETKTLFSKLEKKASELGPNDEKTEYKTKEEEELAGLARVFKKMSSEQVRAKHILISVQKDASMKESSAALAQVKKIKSELASETFEKLAEKYSNDPGSKSRGGDLGVFTRGDMVPEFEKAAFSLNVGQVSEPVRTDFGYHLIKVEEKKAAKKLAFEDVKNDLSEYIYQKSAEKKYEGWLKGLRAKASIKLNTIE